MLEKEFSLGKNIIKSNFTRLDKPYKLTYAATYNCNSRCENCSIWKRTPTDELCFDEVDLFFSKNNYFNWIDVTGGEPFVRPDISDILKSIIKNCRNLHTLHFPTNALQKDKILQTVSEVLPFLTAKLIVSISLDGPKELHDELRGVPGNWDKAVATFKGLKKLGVESYFGMTLAQKNVGLIPQTLSSIQKVDKTVSMKDLHINIIHQSDHFYGNSDVVSKDDEIIQDISWFLRKRGVPLSSVSLIERRYLTLAKKYLKTKKSPISCKALSSSCFINPSGEVYPCTTWDEKLGSLRENDFDLKKIWAKDNVKILSEKAKNLDCPNCWTPCEAYQSLLGRLPSLLF